MEQKNKRIPRLTIALIVITLVLAVLLIAVTVMSLPAIRDQQGPVQMATDPHPTEEPTQPQPTLPPPETNPFDRLDFQYEGRYLKLEEGESIIGVDVSHWQNEIDWEQVKASGVDFAIIKLGGRGYESGVLSLDRYAISNLDGAIAAGLDVGVYFFSQAITPEEAEEEAYFVVRNLEPYAEHITMPVLSEDKSLFPTEVRRRLVEQGVADLKNVTVHPTGDYLISSATFPSYFIKDKSKVDDIQCELDLEIFSRHFAPALGITRRFVGSEPLSPVTNAYNQKMKEYLPPRGIEVYELERKETLGAPISASRVRALLEQKDADTLRQLVPPTTFAYLEEHFLK